MSRTLPDARQAFVAAVSRDTSDVELPRLVAVLDALIAWSAARTAQVAFRGEETRSDVVSFERVGGGGASKSVFWSAQVTRGTGARLEIHAPASGPLTAEERATIMQTLNTHSREVLVEGDRLRIGFGALKSDNARAAVLALMGRLLAGSGSSPAPPAPSAGVAASG